MKVVLAVIVGMLVAGSAWARLGDTADEAEGRYGKPTKETDTTFKTESIKRTYKKGGVTINAVFYPKNGKMVIGWMQVDLSELPAAEQKEVISQMLEASSAGQKWEERSSESKTVTVQRDGATANYGGNSLCMELTDWVKWVAARDEKKKETGSEERRNERKGF
jgi:hypothetical protein